MLWVLLFTSAAVFYLSYGKPTTTTENLPKTDHMKDIISLIPKDLIKNITYEHLKTDEAFKAAVKFMQTEEWNNRIKIIRDKPEWRALKKHLKNFGLNIDQFIKCADGFLKNASVEFDPNQTTPKKSVKSFLIDVGQSLPTMNIISAIHEKMTKDEEMQHLYAKISSVETREMIDNVLALKEVKSLMKDLADMDLNIMDVLSLVYTFLGWGELKVH